MRMRAAGCQVLLHAISATRRSSGRAECTGQMGVCSRGQERQAGCLQSAHRHLRAPAVRDQIEEAKDKDSTSARQVADGARHPTVHSPAHRQWPLDGDLARARPAAASRVPQRQRAPHRDQARHALRTVLACQARLGARGHLSWRARYHIILPSTVCPAPLLCCTRPPSPAPPAPMPSAAPHAALVFLALALAAAARPLTLSPHLPRDDPAADNAAAGVPDAPQSAAWVAAVIVAVVLVIVGVVSTICYVSIRDRRRKRERARARKGRRKGRGSRRRERDGDAASASSKVCRAGSPDSLASSFSDETVTVLEQPPPALTADTTPRPDPPAMSRSRRGTGGAALLGVLRRCLVVPPDALARYVIRGRHAHGPLRPHDTQQASHDDDDDDDDDDDYFRREPSQQRREKEKEQSGSQGGPDGEASRSIEPQRLPTEKAVNEKGKGKEKAPEPANGMNASFEEADFVAFTYSEEESEEAKPAVREWDEGKGKAPERDWAQSGRKRKADDRDPMDGHASRRRRVSAAARKAPWTADVDWERCTNVAEMLHRDVEAFVKYISPTPEEDEVRSLVVELISRTVRRAFPDAQVLPFGSYETKLYLPVGDIDLVVFSRSMSYSATNQVLHSLANTMKRAGITDRVRIIAKAKVPIVKFITTHGRFSVDISINRTNGVAAGQMINRFLAELPALRSLILVIKSFLSQRNMNEVFTGGLGSYSIVCLAISFLQMHPKVRRGEIDPMKNLGVLVMEFFELYGCYFNYQDVGISVRDGGSYFNKAARGWSESRDRRLLSIEDPGDVSNDISKGSYGIAKVRTTFAGAHGIMTAAAYLHAGIMSSKRGGRYVSLRDTINPEEMSILASVMGVTQETINHRRLVQEVYNRKVLHQMLGITPQTGLSAKAPPSSEPKGKGRINKERVKSAWEDTETDMKLGSEARNDKNAAVRVREEDRYQLEKRLQPPRKRRRLDRESDGHAVFTTDDEDRESREYEAYGVDPESEEDGRSSAFKPRGSRRRDKQDYWLSKSFTGTRAPDLVLFNHPPPRRSSFQSLQPTNRTSTDCSRWSPAVPSSSLSFISMAASKAPVPQVNLKDRIAALQQRNATAGQADPKQTAPSTRAPGSLNSLKDKIASFEKQGSVPVPRGSFGLGAPPADDGSSKRRGEMVGNRVPGLSRPTGTQQVRALSPDYTGSWQAGGSTSPRLPSTALPTGEQLAVTTGGAVLCRASSGSGRETEAAAPAIVVSGDGSANGASQSLSGAQNAQDTVIKGRSFDDLEEELSVNSPQSSRAPVPSSSIPGRSSGGADSVAPEGAIATDKGPTGADEAAPSSTRAGKISVDQAEDDDLVTEGIVKADSSADGDATSVAGYTSASSSSVSTPSDHVFPSTDASTKSMQQRVQSDTGDDATVVAVASKPPASPTLDTSEAVIVAERARVVSPIVTRAVLVPVPKGSSPSSSPSTAVGSSPSTYSKASPISVSHTASTTAASSSSSYVEPSLTPKPTAGTFSAVVHRKVSVDSNNAHGYSHPTLLQAPPVSRAKMAVAEPPESPGFGDLADLLADAAKLEQQLSGFGSPALNLQFGQNIEAYLADKEPQPQMEPQPQPQPEPQPQPLPEPQPELQFEPQQPKPQPEEEPEHSAPAIEFYIPEPQPEPILEVPEVEEQGGSGSHSQEMPEPQSPRTVNLSSPPTKERRLSRALSDTPPAVPPKSPRSRYFSTLISRRSSASAMPGAYPRNSVCSEMSEDDSMLIATPPELRFDDGASVRSSSRSWKLPKTGLSRATSFADKLWHKRGHRNTVAITNHDDDTHLSANTSRRLSSSTVGPAQSEPPMPPMPSLPQLSLSPTPRPQAMMAPEDRPMSMMSISSVGSVGGLDSALFDAFPSVPDGFPLPALSVPAEPSGHYLSPSDTDAHYRGASAPARHPKQRSSFL
ncbi:hypothetical protein WOLCODRAFT_148891 [Wolfiporia cocos MD-104 SS10]|uniref:polynucleotide adenylyltransferase n=1 Tax=Wolfiporia cocos (strain MD-104) TaxID=742152 RepID=A0A2H3JMR6_WOLCO|nr:hypothetical protein WOLCODRAFT_148891 [Wolfiporia cocos MD-104 SS10]